MQSGALPTSAAYSVAPPTNYMLQPTHSLGGSTRDRWWLQKLNALFAL